MNHLPPGTRVWYARAGHPDYGLPAFAGEATITRLIACAPCFHAAASPLDEWKPLSRIRTAASICQEPTGYIVKNDLGEAEALGLDSDSVLIVPITTTEAAA